MAGLIWLPDDNTRIDIIPPKPKIAHRFQLTPTFERWWYFAADFGGGQWAIRDADGGEDVLTYRDYRIINGIEQRRRERRRAGRVFRVRLCVQPQIRILQRSAELRPTRHADGAAGHHVLMPLAAGLARRVLFTAETRRASPAS